MFVKSCWQFCELKPTYKVPNIFPGASQCGTICATKIELIFGYIWMIITQFIVPAIILYVIISLIINKISNNKFS